MAKAFSSHLPAASLAREPSAIELASASSVSSVGPTQGEPADSKEAHQTFGQRYPLTAGFLASGGSVAPAAAMTNPFDVVKVRQQLSAVSGCTPAFGTSMLGTARSLVQNEGYGVFLRGISPAAVGGMCFGGFRIGLYHPIKESQALNVLTGGSPMVRQVLAGGLSGTLAAAAFTPLELIKTKMQAKNKSYCIRNMAHMAEKVVMKEGLPGLWQGVGPAATRWAILTASQCATYDIAKGKIVEVTGWDDGFAAQLATSLLTGVVTTTATSPVDVVKSRIFVGGKSSGGVVQVTLDMLRREGPQAFFRGWSASYLRLGPQTMITFLFLEQLRAILGMDSF